MDAIWATVLYVVLELLLILIGLASAGMLIGLVLFSPDAPFVPTRRNFYSSIAAALKVRPNDVVYELGSGTGDLVIELAKRYPEARFVGLEVNPLLHGYARVRKKLAGNPSNVSLERNNFYRVDLSEATKIYAYLLNLAMDNLLPKLQRETPHARVVSRAFVFKALKPSRVIRAAPKDGSHGEHMLYVYDLIK